MARGYMYASGASEEVADAHRADLSKLQVSALGQSKNDYVREIIGSRPDCPLGIMVVLAHDRAVDVRRAVATNPMTSRAVLEHLALDRNLSVVEALVSNPALPHDILHRLARHRRHEVRRRAAARLDDRLSGHTSQPALPVRSHPRRTGEY